MTVTTQDILTEQSIQDVVRSFVEEDLVFRQALDTLDVSDVDNNTIEFPVEQDNMGGPQRIAETAEFPFDEEDVETVTATVEKFGFAVPVSREAQADSLFDVVARNVEKQARRMAEMLDQMAFDEITANLHPNSPAGGQGTAGVLEFQDIVHGRRVLQDDGYSPNLLITNPMGEADLLNNTEFQRTSDLGDQAFRSGQVGRVAGMDVVTSNAGRFTGNAAYLIDTTEYGFEVVKEDVSTDSYYDNSRQCDVFQIWTRRTNKVTDRDAALRVNG